MNLLQQRPSALPPDFHDTRNAAHLLVWGEIGQWLVVDDDLYAFLRRLDGRKTLEEAARETVAELARRGIVRSGLEPHAREPEGIRLANITFNITNRCNLKCSWCYNAGRFTEEMDIDPLMDAVAVGRRLFTPEASFIVLGGEPLIDPPRLLRTLERAEALFDAPVLVSTNGTLVTREIAAALKKRRVEMQVSIDAADRERHDAVRGEGNYERAIAGARTLIDADIHTILSKVYTRSSHCGFEEYLDLALRIGAKEARFIPMRRLGRAGGMDCAPDQLAAFRELAELLQRRKELRPLLGRDFFSILFEMCRRSSRRGGCGIGKQVVFVDADGSVYPCPNHVSPEHRCGSLRDADLAAVLERSPAFAEMGRRYRIEHYTRCAECPFRRWCAGDCRGETLAVTGDPLAPSPHCEAMQALFPEVFWLLSANDERFLPRARMQSTFLT
jgi:radical SAM protein with 4Fe4S-binding SPASM domain